MKILLCLILVLTLAGCASSSSNPDKTPDDLNAAADAGSTDAAAPPTSETSENDLQGEAPPVGADAPAPKSDKKNAAANPDAAANANADANQLDNSQAQIPPPAVDENPPPPAIEPAPPAPVVSSDDNGKPATVTGLDYKANLNGGTIVLRTDRTVNYTTRKNQKTNQYIIELPNTLVPKRFQLPYNTKEFGGPIASINAYQSKTSKTARIVVQLREGADPQISQDGNIISLAGNSGGSAPVAQAAPPANDAGADAAAPNIKSEGAMSGQGGDDSSESSSSTNEKVSESYSKTETSTSNNSNEDKTLTNRTLADFLTGNTKFYGAPISLEVKDTDVRDVFRFISEETGLNIIVGDDVTGKISLKLRKIPWDQALTVILQSRQLGYVKQGGILRIAPLRTLQAETDSARQLIEAQRQLQPLHVQVYPVSYSKAEDLEMQAKDFLSPRGKARADKRTNSLVVQDIDENLVRIKTLVYRLDTQTPQVLIEAKVVEARETFDRLIGVQWGFNGAATSVGANGAGAPVNLTPSFSAANGAPTATTSLNLALGTMDIFGDLNASLQLLETESVVKVLSAPRIVTLDRQDAKIRQTTQFPAFTTQPATATTPATTTIQMQDVTLSLDVRPQITNDGSIIMDVHVTRQFAGQQFTLNNASAREIDTREATTQVLVENGDTVVIGGIYQSDVTESNTGTPWLRKLPLIGGLFNNHETTKDKNELVIFLTPRILNSEKAFQPRSGGAG